MINGEEVTTRSGHWLAIGLPAGTWIDWRYRPERRPAATGSPTRCGRSAGSRSPRTRSTRCRASGGSSATTTPGSTPSRSGTGRGPATTRPPSSTGTACWPRGRFIPAVGNSDSHVDAQTVGLAQTVVRLRPLSTAEVIAAVRAGHAGSRSPRPWTSTFTASLGGRTASCGDRLDAAPTDLVDVRLDRVRRARLAGAGPRTGRVRWRARLADAAGRLTVTAQVPAGVTPFVRAEVRRPDDVRSSARSTTCPAARWSR